MKNNNKQQKAKGRVRFNGLSAFFILAILFCLSLYLVPAFIDMKRDSVHKKAEAIGLFGAPKEIEERHVWISENAKGADEYGNLPVHIMFRYNEYDTWKLRGTGTRLGSFPNHLMTAYHVFEDASGQFGWRKICPNEFSGNEKIMPIISRELANETDTDDSILCRIDTNRTDFPMLSLPASTNRFREWEKKDYAAKVWPAKIHFKTYPKKTIQNVLSVEVTPGIFYFIFDWQVMHGESGTLATVEGEKEKAFLVIIREQEVGKETFDNLLPENRKLMNWSKGKKYGVGVLIAIDQKKL
ncbi:MAG: hypothetical protein NTV72_01475 [Candidatus Taylorbacteria bacterium]|nr:hypothetical protein [Candidatus Taylorbacteria bacterium]